MDMNEPTTPPADEAKERAAFEAWLPNYWRGRGYGTAITDDAAWIRRNEAGDYPGCHQDAWQGWWGRAQRLAAPQAQAAPLTVEEIVELRSIARNDPRSKDEHWFVLMARMIEARYIGAQAAPAAQPARTREGFEAFCRALGVTQRELDRNGRGEYIEDETRLAWEVWQGAPAAQPASQAAPQRQVTAKEDAYLRNAAMRSAKLVSQAAPAAPVQPEPLPRDELETAIDAYLADYEMIGDDNEWVRPTPFEAQMLKDAIIGLLADERWEAVWGAHIRSLAAPAAQPAWQPPSQARDWHGPTCTCDVNYETCRVHNSPAAQPASLTQREVNAIYALRHASEWASSAPHGDNCYVSAHYEGDPGDRCNCGKEHLLDAIQGALDGYPEQADENGELLELAAQPASQAAPADEILRELVSADDAMRRASVAMQEQFRLNPGKSFTFTTPSVEQLRVEKAWTAARQHIASQAAPAAAEPPSLAEDAKDAARFRAWFAHEDNEALLDAVHERIESIEGWPSLDDWRAAIDTAMEQEKASG